MGPAFQAANITTKIIAYDHNCDNPAYPLSILNDAAANPYVDGSAFHLYAGDISALGTVHNLFPNKMSILQNSGQAPQEISAEIWIGTQKHYYWIYEKLEQNSFGMECSQ